MSYLETPSFLDHVMSSHSFGFDDRCLETRRWEWSNEMMRRTLTFVDEEMERVSFESRTGPVCLVWEMRNGGACVESDGPSSPCSHGDCDNASGGLLARKASGCTFFLDLLRGNGAAFV